MLVQFSVENFFSFDEEVVFSMVATGADAKHPIHLVPDVPRKGESLLRAAALYGANASGKSNLVNAISFARDLIVSGVRGYLPLPIRPFKLGDAAENRPCKFEFVIKTQGVLYNYGFRFDHDRILEEWLFATPRKQEVLYFQRTTSKANKVEVEFGPSFTGRKPKQEQFLKFVQQATHPTQLFLTKAFDNNVDKVNPLFSWFQDVCLVISAEAKSRDVAGRAHISSSFTSFLSDFLHMAGTGIEAVTTEVAPFDFDRYTPEMPEWQRDDVREIVARMKDNEATTIRSPGNDRYLLMRGVQGEPVLVQLRMQHRAKDGRLVTFTEQEQSEGTQRLIHLLPALFGLNENLEQVVIIDELDRRMHPLVSRMLVEAATEGNGEPRQSQLIFTTHDTNLLDLDLLRRDEIWFVEKDQGGASHLYSLAEFKVRPDLDIEKGYLNGRFGAIPFIGDVRSLGWTEPQSSETEQTAEVAHAA